MRREQGFYVLPGPERSFFEAGAGQDSRRTRADADDVANVFSKGFGAFQTVPAMPLPVYEKLRVAAVESCLGIGRETALQRTAGSLDILRPAGTNLVYPSAVVPAEILDIRVVLEPSLYLERADAGIGQLFKAAVQTVVLGPSTTS